MIISMGLSLISMIISMGLSLFSMIIAMGLSLIVDAIIELTDTLQNSLFLKPVSFIVSYNFR